VLATARPSCYYWFEAEQVNLLVSPLTFSLTFHEERTFGLNGHSFDKLNTRQWQLKAMTSTRKSPAGLNNSTHCLCNFLEQRIRIVTVLTFTHQAVVLSTNVPVSKQQRKLSAHLNHRRSSMQPHCMDASIGSV